MKKLISFAAISAVLLTPSTAVAQDSIINGDVLYFQDMKEYEPRIWQDGTEHGGMARLASVLEQLQAEEGGAVISVGGDVASGTLFNSMYRGVPFIEAFNELGVDVANFGNHDFDFGATYALELVQKSKFPWISSNLTTTDGAPFSPDGTTAVVNDGDLKIGFLALTAELQRTPASRDVLVQDFVTSAKAAVKSLKQENVDAIVLLSQISKDDTHAVMESVPEIHVALREENLAQSPAEHSQTVDGRWILAPEADYGTVEHLDISKNRTTGAVTVVPRSINVDATIQGDPTWTAKSKNYYAKIDEQLAVQVGNADQDLSKAELGYLVADGYRTYFGTELGIQNGGGQRAEIKAGPVTLRDLKSVLPFGNSVTAVEATGAQIRLLLEQGIQSNPNGGGGFPRTAGLEFTFDPDAEFGKRVTDIKLESGKPFDDAATYTLAVSRFIAEGGDGMNAIRNAERITAKTPIDVDVFESFVRSKQNLAPYEFETSTPKPGENAKTNPATFSATAVATVLAVIAGLATVLPLVFAQQIDAVLGPIARL